MEPGSTFINGAWRHPFILDGAYKLCDDDACPGWMMNRTEGVHYHPTNDPKEHDDAESA